MHVLVVDDNANNRMVIKLFLENYQEEHPDVTFEISEAENGVIAVKKAKEKAFKLIFMDIMMPEMDGIEATKAIRQFDKKVFIAAVSAVEDDERKQIMLKSGAEDYVPKPINGPIFLTRLTSYLKLIESRFNLFKNENHNKMHVFDDVVYTHYKRFYGKSEDALSHFWEYYLLDESTLFEDMSDVVRFIYDLGLDAVARMEVVNIYEEENDEALFFTLKSESEFDADHAMERADKNNINHEYKIVGEKVSIKLPKKLVVALEEKVSTPVKEEPKKELHVAQQEPDSNSVVAQEEPKIEVYDILEPEDKQDLVEFIDGLNSLLLVLSSSDIEPQECDELIQALSQIARVLSSYTEFYTISQSLLNLSIDIANHKENFIAKSHQLATLAKAFGADLIQWQKALFEEGAPSINFMDDSIVSNARMISQFIQDDTEQVQEEESLDDIFDF